MKNKQYNIILRPLAKYFFGGERYYDNDDGVFYFERSRAFPQQTSVLGMLRYQLLLENELLEQSIGKRARIKTQEQDAAATIIGQQSFNGSTTTDYGNLLSLSPVNIQSKDGRTWVMCPKTRQKHGDLEYLDIDFIKGGRLSLGKTESDTIPHLKNFHPKDFKGPENHKGGLEYGFLDVISGDYLRFFDVFEEVIKNEEQIGIYKAYRNAKNVVMQTEDKGFYKYQYMQLKPGFSFSLSVELKEEASFENNTVRLGKEGTPFSLTSTPNEFVSKGPSIKKGDCVLLTSDAYLPENWKSYCRATISRPQTFRNLAFSTKNTQNYHSDPGSIKTPLLNLVQRGTLLYVKENDQAAKDLQALFLNQTAFRNIGYNHFTLLKFS